MQIVDFTKLFIPDYLIVVKGALLLIRIHVQVKDWLDPLKECSKSIHVEFWRWAMDTLIVAVVLILLSWVLTWSHGFCLSYSKEKVRVC